VHFDGMGSHTGSLVEIPPSGSTDAPWEHLDPLALQVNGDAQSALPEHSWAKAG
jgi:hypothetical protein